jgi:hypothetical protein
MADDDGLVCENLTTRCKQDRLRRRRPDVSERGLLRMFRAGPSLNSSRPRISQTVAGAHRVPARGRVASTGVSPLKAYAGVPCLKAPGMIGPFRNAGPSPFSGNGALSASYALAMRTW